MSLSLFKSWLHHLIALRLWTYLQNTQNIDSYDKEYLYRLDVRKHFRIQYGK